MVAQRLPQHMTVDQWRELMRTSHDVKYKYIDGHVYLISGGTANHARIGSNTVRESLDNDDELSL